MRPDQNGEAAQPGLPFGEALAALKCGRRVAREGWNGKGLWLYHVPAATYHAATDAAREHIGDVVPYNAYIALADHGRVSTWAPSTNDALAEDWFVLPEPVPEWNGCNQAEPARPTDPLAEAARALRDAKDRRDYLRKMLCIIERDQDRLRMELDAAGKELDDAAHTLTRIACSTT